MMMSKVIFLTTPSLISPTSPASSGCAPAVPSRAVRVQAVTRSTVSEAVEAMQRQLQSKPLSELRALAKQCGLRGDTKAEIVDLLLSDPGSWALLNGNGSTSAGSLPHLAAAVPFLTGASRSVSAAAEVLDKLSALPMSELRTLARRQGIRAATRTDMTLELVALFSVNPSLAARVLSTSAAAPPAPVAPVNGSVLNGSAAVPAAGPAGGRGADRGRGGRKDEDELVKLGLGELRALARERGVRGDTKAELIAAIRGAAATGAVKGVSGESANRRVSSSAQGAAASAPAQAARAAPSPPSPTTAAATAGGNAVGAKVAGTKAAAPGAAVGGSKVAPAAPAPAAKPKSEAEKALEAMEVGQLKYLAKERGLRAETKEELVQLLLKSGPLSTTPAVKPAKKPPAPLTGSLPPRTSRRIRLPASMLPSSPATSLQPSTGASQPEADTSAEVVVETAGKEMQGVQQQQQQGADVADSAYVSLPPLQSSEDPPRIVVQLSEEELLAELAAMRRTVDALQADASLGKERSETKSTSTFTQSVLIGGLALALVPLLLTLLSSFR